VMLSRSSSEAGLMIMTSSLMIVGAEARLLEKYF
jgi:hypothetical protein